MKIIKESKEELPISFLTAFVSKSWDEVGILKEEIAAIKKEFKGTKKIEELIQNLVDAYLMCIGQMELHLKNKDYLDIETDTKEETKNLKEDVVLLVKPIETETVEVSTCSSCAPETCTNCEPETECNTCVSAFEPDSIDKDEPQEFEYFCDFETPDLTQKLTDEDIYNN